MHTIDIIDDSFPHGTPQGYAQGCRGAGCPALITCRDLHTRYSGDWAFKRLIDAGTPLAEIIALDRQAHAGIRNRDRAAARAAQPATPAKRSPRRTTRAPKPPRPAQPAARTATAPPAPPLPATSGPRETTKGPGHLWLRKARAAVEGHTGSGIAQWQRELDEFEEELDAHTLELREWNDTKRRLNHELRAAQQLLEQTQIAENTGLSLNGAIAAAGAAARHNYAVAQTTLAKHRESRPTAPHRPRPPHGLGFTSPRGGAGSRVLQPHGTNACRARGCDLPECKEAARRYRREWVANRKQRGIPEQHHGTAYGYQLGCKDRSACPAELSCADASLDAERRRAREAGIPEQAARVPAEPVRQHVRELMAAGLSVLGIAELAGVSKTGVKLLLYGRSGARKGEMPAAIEQAKAERLLQVKPPPPARAQSA